jgi:hypothetical protein
LIEPLSGNETGVQWRALQAKLPLRSTRDPGCTDARGLDGSFSFLADRQPTRRISPMETTMTKRIGTAPSLKDFMRRDFLLGSALTAALFIAALLLFPPGAD